MANDGIGNRGTVGRPTYLPLMHSVGVVLGLIALYIRGLGSPAVGFPIAITILSGLGIPSSPKPADESVLRIIHGSFVQGGIRQGALIKGMFAVALLYMGAVKYIIAVGGMVDLLLGTALAISSLANEIEAWSIRKVIEP